MYFGSPMNSSSIWWETYGPNSSRSLVPVRSFQTPTTNVAISSQFRHLSAKRLSVVRRNRLWLSGGRISFLAGTFQSLLTRGLDAMTSSSSLVTNDGQANWRIWPLSTASPGSRAASSSILTEIGEKPRARRRRLASSLGSSRAPIRAAIERSDGLRLPVSKDRRVSTDSLALRLRSCLERPSRPRASLRMALHDKLVAGCSMVQIVPEFRLTRVSAHGRFVKVLGQGFLSPSPSGSSDKRGELAGGWFRFRSPIHMSIAL